MATIVRFTKMHGAGNDYIYVNTLLYNIPDPTKAAIAWSAPHTGVGSDGLVLIGEPNMPEADYSMRIFNADGSEAMMCGNASRCIRQDRYQVADALGNKDPKPTSRQIGKDSGERDCRYARACTCQQIATGKRGWVDDRRTC